MLIQRIVRIVAAVLLLLVQCGCWNQIELNDISIVSATGVDVEDNGKWRMSYQLIIPQAISATTGVSTGGAPVYVFSTESDSIREAVNKTSQELSRKLYFPHNQMVVISEKAARQGIGPLLDVYLRTPDSRETVTVFLTRGKARSILEQLMPLEKIPGQAVQRMIENDQKNGSSFPQMSIHRILLDLLGPTHTAGIPSLTLSGEGELADSVDIMKETHSNKKIRLHQLGLIQGDKLIGWLNEQQSRGVMWLSGRIKQTTVAFACVNGETTRSSSIRIEEAKTTVKPERTKDGFVMQIRTKVKGVLTEYRCIDDLSKPQSIRRMESQIAGEINRMMSAGWVAVKKQHADIVGFGTIIHEKYPQTWNKIRSGWNDKLEDVQIRLETKVSVSRTGMSNNSFKAAQEKTGGQR
ncbi:Ger(x)C family spore germination protein [Paenibacillus mendelii]|uniref:Ger(X)C family spore germination protein n=1 Tax=Paenibacillus mendelii TaxID=206163 RepID=A0ABV6JKP8_9BACL|nr:Ger(x)C family spore germination protein [Paenibacillus mendelii]MCQ6557983.1 Ger(x)C family spore germination protein [Paenibacillus mendelii]